MNILSQIRNVLKQHGIPLSRIGQNHTEKETEKDVELLDEVLSYVWESDVIDEDEVATRFYGEDADRNNNAYKKMKQRLVNCMTNDIINLGMRSSKLTALQKGYYSAHRDYVVATILDGRGAKSIGAYFYRRALRKAVKYDAGQIEMLTLYSLRSHAAAVEKDQRKFYEYNLRYKTVLKKVEAANEVAEYYHSLTIIYDASPKVLADIHQRALGYLEILDGKYALEDLGYLYAFAYFQLKLLCWYSASRYAKASEVADEALAYFSHLPFPYPVQMSVFELHKIVFYTVLKEFSLGAAAFRQCSKYVVAGSTDWIRLQEAGFRLMIYSKRYEEAFAAYLVVVSTNKLSNMPERRRERWRIKRAYFYYLKEAGRIDFDMSADPLGVFKLGRFLNSLPQLDKQKEGNNIPILIIHTLFLIQRGDHLEAIERIDAMEKYLTRYLRRGENYRSKCFIKILLQFAKGDFSLKQGRRRTRSWHCKLLANPLEQSNQSYEMEIVPYEDLYSVMMGLPLE